MLFYIKLAWRNIFRNKRRTIIAGTAIGIGLASLIFTGAMMKGMETNMMQAATASFLGEGQVHGVGFRETQAVETVVTYADDVMAKLRMEPLVDKVTARTLSMAMITAPSGVNGVLLVGVNPETEKDLSQMDDTIQKGVYFEGHNGRDIILGSKLAEILELGLGDRVVVTVAQAHSGDLSQEMFRVSGIFHFNLKEMDSGFAFIRISKAQQMLGLGNAVHQVAFRFKQIKNSIDPALPLWKSYSVKGNEAVSWMEILPQMKAVADMNSMSVIMLVVILGAVVTFGIINTLFMSLYERMFEFAVLRAVGTRAGGLRKLILFEAGALAVVSIGIGLILGFILTAIFVKVGIDYRGLEFAGTTIKDMIYPEMELWQFIVFPIGVFFFTMVVGIYPAWVAGRLNVADALRKSL